MKLLLVSDQASPYIWDHFDPESFRDVSMILSCGDLSGEYLGFLVTMIPAPLFYVPGNHDKAFVLRPPEGCVSLDGRTETHLGLRLAGLGGCRSAKPEPFHYTESAMERRVKTLSRLVRRQGGLDVLLTHVSARNLGDGADSFHQGFDCFVPFLNEFAPRYHIFGHQHTAYTRACPPPNHGPTTLINACGYRIIEY
ncbi:MAG: metallophosphoesterase [Oscillospiraceae bacterium]|jgi:Icc-related predicted phosphoesterase|nr:metallophosphoesterase [Oscillospiraceae bacterium]